MTPDRGEGERNHEKRFWPTPRATDYKGSVSQEAFDRYDEKTRRTRMSTLRNLPVFPTPGTTGLSNGSGNCEKANRLCEEGFISEEERKSFRAGNGGKLNPDWEEWLMGWPIGWTSLEPLSEEGFIRWKEGMLAGSWWDEDPADTGEIPRTSLECSHRKERIKAIGNGQVAKTAAAAEVMLSDFMEIKK